MTGRIYMGALAAGSAVGRFRCTPVALAMGTGGGGNRRLRTGYRGLGLRCCGLSFWCCGLSFRRCRLGAGCRRLRCLRGCCGSCGVCRLTVFCSCRKYKNRKYQQHKKNTYQMFFHMLPSLRNSIGKKSAPTEADALKNANSDCRQTKPKRKRKSLSLSEWSCVITEHNTDSISKRVYFPLGKKSFFHIPLCLAKL